MSTQAIGRWLGEPKKVALLLAAALAAVVMLGVVASTASAATFSNTDGPITINDAVDSCTNVVPQQQQTDAGTASPYPSQIAVSGLASSVSDVDVTLTGLSHTFADDVSVLLVGPEGQKTILMADTGGNTRLVGVNLTFDDAAPGTVPDQGEITSGTYQPTLGIQQSSSIFPVSFPGLAPPGPYGSPSLSVFDGTNPNGSWQLYVIDDSIGVVGSISGWSLDITADPPADTTPPTVTDTSPLQPKKSDNLTATSSEPVQNVSPETFMLERQIASKVKTDPPKYVLVDATVTPSDDGLTAELNPVQDLPKGEYRATIKTAVTDLADNALEEDVVWFFTVKK